MTNRNAPAFPTQAEFSTYGEIKTSSLSGLTKRELFAAMAMHAIITADDYQNVFFIKGESNDSQEKAAVRLADALLAALAESEQE